MVLKCLTCVFLHCFNDPFSVNLVQVHLVCILVFCEYLVCGFHGLNDFGNGHPVVDFTGKPRVILGVPLIVSNIIPSNDLISFVVSNQHGLAIFGHLVLGSYPGHDLGVFGLKDSTEQGPVHGPSLDGFGAVGTAARHALLADVDLPAAEIGGGWFHGFRVWVVNWASVVIPIKITYPFWLLILPTVVIHHKVFYPFGFQL